ncbi:MAG TPA: hypothetical protein IGS40_25760 [Trichormus sp. M33_DOE_039]|nr:hypothetical protein [Trichormus sp. M33_DOE_039]
MVAGERSYAGIGQLMKPSKQSPNNIMEFKNNGKITIWGKSSQDTFCRHAKLERLAMKEFQK